MFLHLGMIKCGLRPRLQLEGKKKGRAWTEPIAGLGRVWTFTYFFNFFNYYKFEIS